jgi:hypothetical protein
MSLVVNFAPTSMTAEQSNEAQRRLKEWLAAFPRRGWITTSASAQMATFALARSGTRGSSLTRLASA